MYMLSAITDAATNRPSIRWGSFLQSHAAIGAQIIPPTIRPSTTSQLKFAGPMRTRKVMASAAATNISAKLTEPMALHGLQLLQTSVVVAIGPHPPPPNASVNAATYPKGTRAFDEGCVVLKCPLFLDANLNRIMKPMIKSTAPTRMLGAFPDICVSTKAPVTPPKIPGITKCNIQLRSTLPNFKCAPPEAKPVNTFAVWTLALAKFGNVERNWILHL